MNVTVKKLRLGKNVIYVIIVLIIILVVVSEVRYSIYCKYNIVKL